MADRLAAVTGATGFLGRHIVTALGAAGWQVRILARKAPAGNSPVTSDVVIGDLLDRQALRKLVDGADAVIHAAGLIKAPTLAAFRAVNVGGTDNLVRALNDCPTPKRLVLVSSMAAREPQLSAYAATKRESELVVASSLSGPSHDWAAVRPCAIYGPADTETLAIFRAAGHWIFPLPGPRQGRVALIHARDAAEAIVRLCDRGQAGRVFELTDPRIEGYRWPEVIAAAEKALDTKVFTLPLPAVAVRSAAAMNMLAARIAGRTPIFTLGKAREILHADWGSSFDRLPPPEIWQPRIGIDDGFRDTVSWYREHGWLRPNATKKALAGHGAH